MTAAHAGGHVDSDGLREENTKCLPGSRAATINVLGFLNSLPRMLLQTSCGLQRFLLTTVQRPHGILPPTSKPGHVWPCPMPYPEVFTKGAAARLPDVHFKRLVNLQVMTLSWYHLGCPSVAPQCLVLGARLSAKQWTVIRNLEFLARDRNFTEFVSAADMGRSASKVEDLQDCMDVLGRAAAQLHDFDGCYAPLKPSKESVFDEDSLSAGTVVGRVQHDPVVTAKPIEADRLVFPGPPSFDPRPFMDADTVQRYDFPLQTSLVHEGDLEEPPQVTIRATRENKLKLYKKLYETGRLQPLKADTFFAKYPSGLFAVGKDQHRDRMILDGRPANVADRPQRKWARALASGSTLSQLHLLPEYDLCVSGEDLKDYFYQFKVGSERVRRNVLCGPVDLCDAHAVFGDSFEWSEDPIYVGLSTLAMGDVNAVEFAQSSHLGLCFHFGVANPDEVLTLQGAIPRGLLQVGIIVDDLIILEQVLKSMRVKPDAPVTTADERIDRALHAYRSVGLEHNPKKEFRNETLARFWGLEVDGQKGLLRSSSLRLWPLCLITMRVVRLGLATVGLLESLAGSWVSIFSIRRKLFCILDLVFEPLGIPDQKKVIRLSPGLVSELCSLVIMGTLAVVNLRADFMDKVMATDASEKWMAGVSAYCPRNIVKEVSRYSLRKAVWTKLLTPLRARDRSLGILSPEDELPDDHYETHPLWVLLARCLQYGNSWREQVRRHTHINILELRAHLRQVRRLSTSTSSVRALHGLDSQVSLGCLIKGRSSSSSLNSEMQKSMCFSVGSDLYDNYMYFPSADNPSDGPSRESDVPAPTMPLPPWWHDLSEGDSQSFDSWMAAFDMDIFLGGVDFSELCHAKDVDICTGAFMKRKDFLKKLASHRAPGAALDRPKKSGNCSHSSSASQGRKVRAGHGSVLPPEACDLLLSFDDKQFFFEGDFLMLDRPGGLDLFSGRCGVAREMVRQGAPWVLTFDWNRSSAEDLLNPDLRDKLVTLLKLQAFKTFGAAPICSSFSVAVTPAVRSTQYPRGLPGMRATMRQKVREGNSHSDWLIELVELCDAMGVIWWVENPDSSFWWRQKRWRKYRDSRSRCLFRFCMCRFGTAWRKATRIATNSVLAGVKMWCSCLGSHVQLRGDCAARGKPWTLIAQPYPRGLCRLIAAALCEGAGWATGAKLDIAKCARCGSMRIGEASNPGPRRPRGRQSFSLESVPTVSATTLALEARLLRQFFVWFSLRAPDLDPSALFHQVPIFLPQCLRAYGDCLFQEGGSLFNLRHVLIAAQRWCPGAKPYMQIAWEIVERWELQCPVTHRVPVPEILVKALCSLAWHRRWYTWVGITILAFYGAGRLGEVILCKRQDLVLPGEMCTEVDVAFLRLLRFKSLLRQPARVQHMKVSDPYAVVLLGMIFGRLQPDEMLFPASHHQYRKRWDLLLDDFGIPKSAGITPGGLRGGSAVFHYHTGKPIADILWMMRLRSQTTLESYLQEVAALNVLSSLSMSSKCSIKVFATTLPLLTSTSSSGS